MQRTLKALEFDKVLEKFSQYCVSQSAKEKALNLLPYLTPYGDEVNSLKFQQNLFYEAKAWLSETNYQLKSFPELDGILTYLNGSHPFLDADAFWAIKETLIQLKNLLDKILEFDERYSLLAHYTQLREFPQEIFEELTRCIGDNATIKDTASPKLLLIRNELKGHNQNCMKRVKEAVSEYNILHYLQDDYITLDSDRYVLPLKANFKGRLQGIIHHYSNTGETVFFEPLFLVEINNRIQELKQEEREEERIILQRLTSSILDEAGKLNQAWQLLLDLDILLAKLSLAADYHGHCLSMEENAPFNLSESKHPLLALEALTNKKLEVRPLDIQFNTNQSVMIISGGNAGGKTVCLKTAGLIVLMTLAGLPVPLKQRSTLPIIEKIHAFIGDEQSLDDHVSTFTGQIRHLSRAWEELDSKTLILLDEFGAGTDPAQGAALAQAVIDGILEKNSYAFAATHFPALKTYALSHQNVRAASMLFDNKNKKPLFTIVYDQVGASIALDVAREHGLPESILKKAEQYLLLDGEDMTKIVDTLNALAVEREKELVELKKQQEKTEKKKLDLQERFEKERKKLNEEVRALSKELMLAWKEGKSTAKQAMKEMAKLRADLQPLELEEKQELSKDDIESNFKILKERSKNKEEVVYIPWDKKAQVFEIDEKNKKAKIDINGVSLWASIQDLSLDKEKKSSKKSSVKSDSSTNKPKEKEELTRQRLDIRGKRADIAIIELESYLDKALLNSTDIVEIVHGKGTGALRKSVHDFLRTSPIITHFERANEDQGGDGLTLAYLK